MLKKIFSSLGMGFLLAVFYLLLSLVGLGAADSVVGVGVGDSLSEGSLFPVMYCAAEASKVVVPLT